MSLRSTLILISLALLLPGQSAALGLGEIELKSGLNQPFLAEVDLISATDQDLQSLRVQLASADAYTRYGLDRPFVLTQLRFDVVGTGDGAVVRIFTREPIREPFLSFLISAEWSAGRLLREYTVLLDPPTFMDEAPTTSAPPIQSSTGTSARSTPAPATQPAATTSQPRTQPAQQSQPAQQPQATAPRPRTPVQRQPAVQPGGTYGAIQRSETLWRIAQSLRPDASITINQMMMALYNANPEAFYGNINRLKAGYVLQVPELAEIRAITRDQAFADVRQHNEAWRAGVPLSAMSSAQPTGDRQPQLRLTAPDGAGGAGTGTVDAQVSAELQAELDATRRALNAAQVSNQELGDEVSNLADEVDERERLLSVKDSQIADLQQRLRTAGEDADVLPSEPYEQFADETADVTQPGAGMDGGMVEGGATADDLAPSGMSEDAADTEGTTADDMAAGTEDGAAADEAAGDAAQEPAAAADTGVPQTSGARPVNKSFMDQILDNLLYVGIAVLLLILAVWGFFFFRSRRSSGPSLGVTTDGGGWDAEADTPTEIATADGSGVTGLLQEDEGEERDDGDKTQRISKDAMQQTMVEGPPATPPADDLESTMAAGAPINLDDSDAIAEADFNMAYGLYDQAADGLKKALADEPGRRDLTLKLLEVYFVWGNTEEFVVSAKSFKDIVGGVGDPDWDKVVIMGKQICPDEDLFSGSIGGGGADVDLGFGDEDAAPAESDLDIFGDDDVFGGGAAGPAPAAAPAASSGDGDSLGIDLDSLGGEDEATMAASEADLLDFELGDLSGGAAASAPAPSAAADDGEDSLDLGLNLDTGADLDGGTGFDMETGDDIPMDATQRADSLDPPVDTGLTGLLDEDMLTSIVEAESEPAAGDGGFDAAMDELSSYVDTGVEDSSADPSTDSIFGQDGDGEDSIDLSTSDDGEFSLGDLDGGEASGADFDLSMDGDAAEDSSTTSFGEVGTKLDLARAYVDMGDPDGARSILEEVLQEGDAAQKQEAQDLLGQIG